MSADSILAATGHAESAWNVAKAIAVREACLQYGRRETARRSI
jgi:hypothetical protein